MSTSTLEPRYKLTFTVPHSSLEACKSAVFAKGEKKLLASCLLKKSNTSTQPSSLLPPVDISLATFLVADVDLGAGSYPGGKYSMVCFETQGTGQFLPGEGAVPNIGAVGKLERVPETKVEVLCVGTDVMTGAVNSLKR